MSDSISKEDQDWLDRLAGKSPEGIDSLSLAQAAAVRNAIISRRDAIEAEAVSVGDIGLNKIRARLQREGLMNAAEKSQQKNSWWKRLMSILNFGSREGSFSAGPIWGLAASLTLAVLVMIKTLDAPLPNPADVYRGNATATVLIVDNPLQKKNKLLNDLKPLTESIEVAPLANGGFELRVRDSEKVQVYLYAQRIEPTVVDGYITINVVSVK